MDLKKEILEKIPDYLKEEPEFKTLLEQIKVQNIKEKEEMLDFLKREIEKIEKWLMENKKHGGTMVKNFRDKVVQLDVLKKCKKMLGEFLV